MQAKAEYRNQFVDIMRGIAMLLVVLGHAMTGCTVDSQKSFLFNIIWSLQMPLFILISGFVTKYSRPISDGKGLWKYVKRRTVAYMLPWAVWSFLVRGITFGEKGFLNVKHLLWNMDSGYWFLATIWTISMIFGIASFVAERVSKENLLKRQIVLLGCYLVGMVLLVGIGAILGFSFFAIKLTLYYMPFYYAGFLYGQFDDKIKESETGKRIIDSVVAVCFAVWLFVILRYSIYDMSDGITEIILRVVTSLTGCIAICGICKELFTRKSGEGLRWIGQNSMEVYLVHYLLLCLMRINAEPMSSSPIGVGLILVNYLITVDLTVMVIIAIKKNKVLRVLLTGKGK